MLVASDSAPWLRDESLANAAALSPPITAMSGTTASVTSASCHAALNPTTKPATKVAM
jgi:hypothetical protein